MNLYAPSPLMDALGIDQRDVTILTYFMNDPFVSQTKLAQQLKLSQPSVNARIRKLREQGLLRFEAGIDFKTSNLVLCRVDFTAKDAGEVLNYLQACTFFVNGMLMSGKHNVSVFFVTESLTKMEEIVNTYVRNNPDVSDVNVNVIAGSARPLSLKFHLDEKHERNKCFAPHSCAVCKIIPKKLPAPRTRGGL